MPKTTVQLAPVRVLIADDHPVVRMGLTTIIQGESDFSVAAEVGSGQEAIAVYRPSLVDVGLIDLRMPDLSGVDVIRTICSLHPGAKMIVLTTYEGDEDIRRALSAGAMGYLIKAMPHQILVDAIRSVARGRRFIPPSVAQQISGRLPKPDLTARELQVLRLIVLGRSNREIAEDLGITEGTVKCHVNVILDRLGVSARTQAAVAALQRGIVHL